MKSFVKKFLSCSALFIATAGTPARGDFSNLVFHQELEGVYSQNWFAQHLEQPTLNAHEVYVKGVGKLGDFFGVLYLDCTQPKYSRWIAQGGNLRTDAIPYQAIAEIRLRFC